MFGSSALARTIVRRATAINEFLVKVIPAGMRRWIDSRFNKDEVILEMEQHSIWFVQQSIWYFLVC